MLTIDATQRHDRAYKRTDTGLKHAAARQLS
jgi:hypothetical protein